MKFLLDENLPSKLLEILRTSGHEAISVADLNKKGQPDSEIIEFCKKQGHSLLTLDFDFSDIRHYPPKQYNGIVVFKTANQSKQKIIALAEKFLPFLKTEPLKGQLWIVEENKIRIRE